MIVFDSVDEADLDSLAFLERLQARLAGSRSLLCVAAADPSGTLLGPLRRAPVEEIRLQPFTDDEIRELVVAHLVRSTARVPPLDDEELRTLVAWMRRETGGVPAAVEGALDDLIRRGHLRPGDATWSLDTGALRSEPKERAARALVAGALRPFPPRRRALLRFAAVCGTEFDPALLPGAEGNAAVLAEALRRGVLTETRAGAARLRFRRADVARALAGSVPATQRRTWHREIAATLRARGAPASLAPEIARHLDLAGDAPAARAAYVGSAEAACATGAFLEADRFFRRAWELGSDEDRRCVPPFAAEWIRSLFVNGRVEDTARVAEEILAASEPSGADAPPAVRRERLRAAVWHATALAAAGHGERADDAFRALFRGREIARHPALHAWALLERGRSDTHRNRHAAARKHLEKARGIAMAESLPRVAGRAELGLGIVAWREDDATRALEWHRRAHDHLMEGGAHDFLPAVWGNQAICHWSLLEPARAASLHRRAAEGYLRRHRRAEAARSYQNLTHVLTELGQWAEADAALAASDELNRSLRAPRQASYFEYHAARLALYRGRLEEASNRIDRAMELASELQDDLVVIGHGCLRGLIQLDADRVEDAARTGESCLQSSRRAGYRWGIAKSLYVLARSEHARGRTDVALDALDEASRVATESRQPVVLYRIKLAHAALLAAAGTPDRAGEALGACRALQERSGSPFWEGLLRRAEADVAAAAGRHDEASAALAGAYEIFARLGAERLRADTLLARAKCWTALGNRPAATSALRHASALLRGMGLRSPQPDPPDRAAEGASAAAERFLELATSIAREVASVQSLDDVLRRILDTANTYLGSERGVIALLDPSTGRLRVRCTRAIDPGSVADGVEICWTSLERARAGSEVVFSDDALADPRLNVRESVRRARIRSLIAVPIRWRDRALGAIYLDHRSLTDLFGPAERSLLSFLATMAAVGIRNAQELEVKEEEVRNLRGELEDDDLVFPQTVVGRGHAMRALLRRGLQAARDPAGGVVLLTGPSGVGKDHVARLLHEASGRRGDFVQCPLPTLPETLIEGELFGVARGAATMVESRVGLVEVAQHGTLFLNEIGDLALALQPKLLHFLDGREYRRVGSPELRRFDGLVVCATNADLERKVEEGAFREDLFYRLSACTLELPPLRERAEDIPALADLFLREFARTSAREPCVLHPDSLDLLLRCSWEGNVRELRSCLAGAVAVAPAGLVEPRHLESPSLRRMEAHPSGDVPLDPVSAAELRVVREAMIRSGGIIVRAARLLGCSDTRLRRKLVRYRLKHLILQPKPRAGSPDAPPGSAGNGRHAGAATPRRPRTSPRISADGPS
jgi:transcriptional regulator with GAF, ATPase, and Fis domain/tetratricopeptide (TPR) repeat protein